MDATALLAGAAAMPLGLTTAPLIPTLFSLADLNNNLMGDLAFLDPQSIQILQELSRDKRIVRQLKRLNCTLEVSEKLIDKEILNVGIDVLRKRRFLPEAPILPNPLGDLSTLHRKIYVPVERHPHYNFIGRILGPKGMTNKLLEEVTGCKIMIRGKGSMRDPAVEKRLISSPKENHQHLKESLHVLVQCDDTPNRANVKLALAEAEIHKLLIPKEDEQDELKRVQLALFSLLNDKEEIPLLLAAEDIPSPLGTLEDMQQLLTGPPIFQSPNAVVNTPSSPTTAKVPMTLPNSASNQPTSLQAAGLPSLAVTQDRNVLQSGPLSAASPPFIPSVFPGMSAGFPSAPNTSTCMPQPQIASIPPQCGFSIGMSLPTLNSVQSSSSTLVAQQQGNTQPNTLLQPTTALSPQGLLLPTQAGDASACPTLFPPQQDVAQQQRNALSLFPLPPGTILPSPALSRQ